MSKRLFDIMVSMKNRDYKEFAPGVLTHIYNRGNNKEKIFWDDQDYKAFLFRLGLALGFDEGELEKDKILSMPYSRIRINGEKNLFNLHAFCLMPNHFHLIIEQLSDVPTSKLISRACTSYAKYINQKYKKVGHVFQDCFKANTIDTDEQLIWTSAYIHMNPVKDTLVKEPSEYKWSSYNDFIGKRNLSIVYTDFIKSLIDLKNFKKETLNFNVKETL